MAFAADLKSTGVLNSTADLSADGDQFKIMKLNASVEGEVVVGAAVTDIVQFILENKPKAGERALLTYIDGGGIAKVRLAASATITVGLAITCTAAGLAIEAATGEQAIGYALSAESTASGKTAVISVLLHPHIAL